MSEHPSRFTLAQWKVSDLSSAELAEIERHAEQCGDCRATLAAIERLSEEQESRLEQRLAAFDERLEAAVARSRRRTSLVAAGTIAAAAGIALVLVLAVGTSGPRPATEQPAYTGLKGTMKFQVVAKRGDNQFRVDPGAELRENDALRFVVVTDRGGWVAVFSVDTRGAVSPFYPDTEPDRDPSLLRLDGAGRHELPGSIVLDDATGPEHLVVVFSPGEFDRGEVFRWAREISFDSEPLSLGELGRGRQLTVGVVQVVKR
jgi:hypothetical protein